MSTQILDALRMPWPTDWSHLFGREGSPIVEIGFGSANYLLSLATERPEANVLGLEISNQSLIRAQRKLDRSQVDNVRLIRGKAHMFFWLLCRKASVHSVHINFPDPWPKAAHSSRRLVNNRFLTLLASRVIGGGLIHVATDDAIYANSIAHEFVRSPHFDNTRREVYRIDSLRTVQTKYELQAKTMNRPRYYFEWKRNNHNWVIEIPLPKEHDMPHATVYLPLNLEEVTRRIEPAQFTSGEMAIRFIDFFRSSRSGMVVVDTYVSEGDLEQRLMLSIKERKNNIFLISLRETGFPRPTSATHYAIHYLAEIIASMHERSEISEDNLQLI